MSFFNRKKDTDKKKVTDETDQQDVAVPTTTVPKTGDMHSYRIIRGPHVTEKASNLVELGKYVFKVSADANKIEIQRSIEKLYKVKVANVHVLHMPSKFRQVGRHQGERSGFKKAIVTLRGGEKIDMN